MTIQDFRQAYALFKARKGSAYCERNRAKWMMRDISGLMSGRITTDQAELYAQVRQWITMQSQGHFYNGTELSDRAIELREMDEAIGRRPWDTRACLNVALRLWQLAYGLSTLRKAWEHCQAESRDRTRDHDYRRFSALIVRLMSDGPPSGEFAYVTYAARLRGVA